MSSELLTIQFIKDYLGTYDKNLSKYNRTKDKNYLTGFIDRRLLRNWSDNDLEYKPEYSIVGIASDGFIVEVKSTPYNLKVNKIKVRYEDNTSRLLTFKNIKGKIKLVERISK